MSRIKIVFFDFAIIVIVLWVGIVPNLIFEGRELLSNLSPFLIVSFLVGGTCAFTLSVRLWWQNKYYFPVILVHIIAFFAIYTSSIDNSSVSIDWLRLSGAGFISLIVVFIFDRFYFKLDVLTQSPLRVDELSELLPRQRSYSLTRLVEAERSAVFTSTLILLLIVLAIGATIALILLAGRIVSLDTANTNIVQIAETRLSTSTDALKQSRRDLIENSGELERAMLLRVDAVKSITEINSKLKGETLSNEIRSNLLNELKEKKKIMFDANVREKSSMERQLQLKSAVSLNESVLRKDEGLVSSIIEKLLTGRQGSNENWFGSFQVLFTAGLTRVGILILAIYLVRFLVQLYEYNVRLAAHYRCQWHALLLIEESPTKIRNIESALRAGVNFNRSKFTDKDPMLAGISTAFSELSSTLKDMDNSIKSQKDKSSENTKK